MLLRSKRMTAVQPLSIHTVLQSADHASLVASFLALSDLLSATELSSELHSVFDGDAVWQSRLNEALPAASSADTATAKQRYIKLLGCSEHGRNQCFHLVSPRRLKGAPLCASCRTRVIRCLTRHFDDPRGVGGLVRASATVWYARVFYAQPTKLFGFFYYELHMAAVDEQQRRGRKKRKVDGRTEAAPYRLVRVFECKKGTKPPAPCAGIWNACKGCDAELANWRVREMRFCQTCQDNATGALPCT